MFGAVVLKDIPKEEIRIDIFKYQISGGFRGFFLIPFGLHYLSIKFRNKFKGFWFYIKPYTAIVKIFNYETEEFEEVDQETFNTFRHLALSGQMGAALINYPVGEWVKWNKLVSKINEHYFSLKNLEQNQFYTQNTREIIELSKKNDYSDFFADLQFSFITWIVDDANTFNKKNFEFWQNLIEKILNSEKELIIKNYIFFDETTKIILSQFQNLEKEWLSVNNKFLCLIKNYIELLKSTEIDVLLERVKEFEFIYKK